MSIERRSGALAALLALAATLAAPPSFAQDLERGRELYDRWCAECHGVEGDGQGAAAAYMLPRPRDFTTARYQIRTTASGQLPTDADIVRIIEQGMPGTAMPGWESKFNDAEVRDLVAYLKSFSRFFEQLGAPEPLDFGEPPGRSEEALAEGRELYRENECFRCHGDAGRGDGPSAPTLQDDRDFPIRAADLTENWYFNGGGTAEDIFRRFRTGLDGTPMPSYSDLLDAGLVTEEQLWHLAHYVRSLAPERRPVVRDVIAAARLESRLPGAPDDSLWDGIRSFYIPLVGQVIEEERWFAPTVDGVYVQAAHDGSELVLRLRWHDPSESPDSAWLEWQQRVAQAMFPLQDSTGLRLLPDRFTVQFPMAVPTGRERPYFLMGDSRRPVYQWGWASEPGGVSELQARGLGTAGPAAADGGLEGSATWDAGEWRLVFRRSLTTADTAAALQFQRGVAIPIAFFAWDGSNAETGTRMSVSSWYSIYLEEPTPGTVYISPIVAMLLTAGLGVLVIYRAQRREGAADAPTPT